MREKPRSRNSTRDRENAERVALRRLVDQLDAHLTSLRRGQLPSTDDTRRLDDTWRSLAQRQARARRAAERANAALNEQVQANADWIQRLWELLGEKRQRIKTLQFSKQEDPMVFARLKQDVRLASLQSHQAFVASHIRLLDDLQPSVELEEHWSHVKTPGFGSRLACVRHLPFDAQATAKAVWAALTGFESSVNAGYGDIPVNIVERSADECALKYQAQIQLGQREDSTTLEYHAVARQVTGGEAHGRNLFVWQSVWTDNHGRAEHMCVAWIAVASCASRLGSVIAIVAQSQVRDTSESSLAALQTAVMPCVDVCIDEVLVSVESTLFDGEKALRGMAFSGSQDASIHSVMV